MESEIEQSSERCTAVSAASVAMTNLLEGEGQGVLRVRRISKRQELGFFCDTDASDILAG